MQGMIFLLDRKRTLVPMDELVYESDDLLQTLLAEYATSALAYWPDEKIHLEF